jgi:hypothetical protein
MSWGAQSRSEDAKTPSASRGRSQKPELGCCPIQPHMKLSTSLNGPQRTSYAFIKVSISEGVKAISILSLAAIFLSPKFR